MNVVKNEEGVAVEILLVDDNPRDVELTLRSLRHHKILNRVHVARDGAEAVEFIFAEGAYAYRKEEKPPRVILLDYKMPKMDGLEVLQRIKANELTKTIPVVMLTSSNQDRDILDSYRLGANSYIVKPVDFQNFEQAISKFGFYWLLLNQPVK